MIKNEDEVVVEKLPIATPMSIEKFSDKWIDFQEFVKSQLKENVDYGKVSGIPKPFLMLPGAQKILSRYLVRPEYTVTNRIEDWDKGLFNYEVKCVLRAMQDGRILGEGIGSCNSYEEKYRYLWVSKKKLGNRKSITEKEKTGKYGKYVEYKVQRDDIASIVNTILKMSKKRSLIDASLTLANASEYFTQDIEDIPDIAQENNTKQGQNLKKKQSKKNPATEKQLELLNELKVEIREGFVLTFDEADQLIKDTLARKEKKKNKIEKVELKEDEVKTSKKAGPTTMERFKLIADEFPEQFEEALTETGLEDTNNITEKAASIIWEKVQDKIINIPKWKDEIKAKFLAIGKDKK